MKSFKNLGKLAGILFGSLGLGSIFASCSKEVTCVCSYQYGNVSYDVVEMTTEGDCAEADVEFNHYGYGSASSDLDCREK